MSKLENGATASMNSNWLHEHDQTLREQIAKEIEALINPEIHKTFNCCWSCEALNGAAAVARGQK